MLKSFQKAIETCVKASQMKCSKARRKDIDETMGFGAINVIYRCKQERRGLKDLEGVEADK